MNKSVITGIALITIGAIFLLPNFTDVSLKDLWPVLMLGPGLLFFVGYICDRKSYGLLMPGSILTVYGLLFFSLTLFGWEWIGELWPLYLIGPGVGFILMHYLGKKETGLLVAGTIFTLLGVILLLVATGCGFIWPIVIILAGVLLILHGRSKPPAA